MRKFILIEHSLKGLGGHYYTYAYSILKAAERAGFQPVLVTHREFRDEQVVPKNWPVHTLFPHRSDWIPSYGTQALPGAHAKGLFARWKGRVQQALQVRTRRRLSQAFAAGLQSTWARVPAGEGDQVFVATASDIDLEGLSLFLQSMPQAQAAQWHVQFHHPIFRGREPDYPTQSETREMVRAVFQQALSRVPGHRIRFHCTTEQLTAQYQFLDVARFETLPYAIHDLFVSRKQGSAGAQPGKEELTTQTSLAPTPRSTLTHTRVAPARIALLGHTRNEKGYGQLPALIGALWERYLGTGRAQLVLQTGRAKLRKRLDRLATGLGGPGVTTAISYAPSPLDLEPYADLTHSVDIGLLLYNGERYYARCSGVLLEMLIAGIPVVVPAGSWLSEQIDEENQRYLEQVAREHGGAQTLTREQLNWTRPRIASDTDGAEGLALARDAQALFGCEPAVMECEIAAGSTMLMLEFEWVSPQTEGTYLRLALAQSANDKQTAREHVEIASRRQNGQIVRVLFALRPQTTQVHLSWSNAWADGPIAVSDIHLKLLNGATIPTAALGAVAAGPAQIVSALEEVLTHLDHYQHHAQRLAAHYAQRHSAEAVVAQMTTA